MAVASLVQPYQHTHRPCPDQRAVAKELVQKVHHCIECCLIRRLTLPQTVTVLASFGFDSALTEIVWKQLEVQNPQFFSVYTQQLSSEA